MKYFVEVKEIHSFLVEVDAQNPEDAADKANAIIEAGDGPDEMNYVDTMDKSSWNIQDEEGNYYYL